MKSRISILHSMWSILIPVGCDEFHNYMVIHNTITRKTYTSLYGMQYTKNYK